MWRMSLSREEAVDPPYPERSGEPDCPYYMRTGLCGFGANCKFNHPPNRRLVSLGRNRGEYPERPGQIECQYYLKTGTCKFGPSCKYHHPRERAGSAARVQLNVLNLPLRPGEKDCPFYMRTGNCKFGATCKFNHPPPMIHMPGSPLFPGVPGTGNVPPLYSWPISRPVYMSSPRPAGPSIAPIVVPPSPVSVPQWPYQVPIPVQEGQQQPLSGSYIYGPPQEPVAVGLLPHFMPSSGSVQLATPSSPSASGFREEIYPERPGEPECQFYMKTGECRYGSQCRYHHPRDRNASPASFFTSAGLPMRPGAPPCTFYSRFGYCKFGAGCKFDHPMPATSYPQVRADIGMPHPYTMGVISVLPGSGAAAPSPELSMDMSGQPYSREILEEGVPVSASLQAMDIHHGSS
ncbi:hypothetical protein KP509_34G043900 [Ceratopteris richardii]|nr:hypothetical protein KP509_34G043900 [Ceratopteris richardii]